MKIIQNKILPIGKRFYAINLCGVLFAKGPCSERIINHEGIHSRQIFELVILPFYILYVLEWIIKLILYRDFYQAYQNISFEREAYQNESDLNYLKRRKPFNFIRYYKN